MENDIYYKKYIKYKNKYLNNKQTGGYKHNSQTKEQKIDELLNSNI